MKYIIYTDGGSRGNPGPAAAAFIIKSVQGERIDEKGIYMGYATNNEAEYTAVEKALELLISEHQNTADIEIEFRADSQLVVSQLSGKWKIKNERIRAFYDRIKNMESNFSDVNYNFIARALNYEADLLVNITLDNQNSQL